MISAIIVAAGSSRRMGFDKLAAPLAGRPVLECSVRALAHCTEIAEIVLVTSPDRWAASEGWVAAVTDVTRVPIRFALGGSERHDSVAAGLAALDPATTLVAVHDGARPLVSAEDLHRVIAAARATGAASLAHPVVDTLKRADATDRVTTSVDRDNLWAMETPQVFEVGLLRQAYEAARACGQTLTDEVSAVQAAGRSVRLVASTSLNLKITHPHDLELAAAWMRRSALPSAPAAGKKPPLRPERLRRDHPKPTNPDMSRAYPKLHNAMWPGLVGKEPGTDHPPISLDRMLELTANASVDGQKFEGVDLFLFHPHIDPDATDDAIRALADTIAGHGLAVGSLVAPVWPGTVGGSAMGSDEDRKNFVLAVEKACRIAGILNAHGVRKYGVIRIDSASGVGPWAEDPAGNTRKIAQTFREAARVANDHGERLAAEGEICWGGMHSWRAMLATLEAVGMPETVGFQADLAHTYLYLLGYNAPGDALLREGYSNAEFEAAYTTLTDALRPWTIDFHVAQNDGSVHGTGNHDKTGRHCPADDPNGKLDITRASGQWLQGAAERGIRHICWDGCMFPNAKLEQQETWNTILAAMIKVRAAHGWA